MKTEDPNFAYLYLAKTSQLKKLAGIGQDEEENLAYYNALKTYKPKIIKEVKQELKEIQAVVDEETPLLVEIKAEIKKKNKIKKRTANKLAQEYVEAREERLCHRFDRDKDMGWFMANTHNIWSRMHEGQVKKDIDEYFENEYANTKLKNVYETVKIRMIKHIPIKKTEYLYSPHHNTLYSLKNNQIITEKRKPLPKDYCEFSLDMCPGETACFDKFMAEICSEDEEKIKYLLELTGYILTPFTHLQFACNYIGRGSNGKSNFLHIQRAAAGDYTTNASLKQLMTDKFALAELNGMTLCVSADINSIGKDVEWFKNLVDSENTILAQKKHQDLFQFINKAKLIFSSNSELQTPDQSYGFFRRIQICRFHAVFPAGQFNPADKIIEKELKALRYKCFQAFLETKGYIQPPESITQETQQYQENFNPISAFLQRYQISTTSFIPTKELYEAYREFFTEQGFQEKLRDPNNVFSKKLKEIYPEQHTKKRYGVEKKNLNGYTLQQISK